MEMFLQLPILRGERSSRGDSIFHFEIIRKANIESPNPEMLGDPASNKLLIQAYRYSMLHGAARC